MALRQLALGVLAAFWAGAAGAQGKGFLPYEDSGAVARGETLYQEFCASCHGVDLEGETANWRERKDSGRMPAPPHDASGHTWHHPDMVLFRLTKLGVEAVVGQGYESDMPGFGDVLSDAQIIEILAYIKSTWPDDVIGMHNARSGS
ncbi:Cytochrome c, mono-and diheme variants [Salinihabitans flavidus]|uniref:Cytochrome c, mono-and diheme variants n=1 Tax=Salinihabitans flavidus TaxID=569882 RepID=A0A1H8L969_9RHOB|nr:cytochrome c [Salinihabitans flavidus]SEO01268.1 Cytochrome c, mono-and diheme variants [Salinihabitans flavidus]